MIRRTAARFLWRAAAGRPARGEGAATAGPRAAGQHPEMPAVPPSPAFTPDQSLRLDFFVHWQWQAGALGRGRLLADLLRLECDSLPDVAIAGQLLTTLGFARGLIEVLGPDPAVLSTALTDAMAVAAVELTQLERSP